MKWNRLSAWTVPGLGSWDEGKTLCPLFFQLLCINSFTWQAHLPFQILCFWGFLSTVTFWTSLQNTCAWRYTSVHAEQQGHRKPLSPLVTSQQVSETQCGASQADAGILWKHPETSENLPVWWKTSSGLSLTALLLWEFWLASNLLSLHDSGLWNKDSLYFFLSPPLVFWTRCQGNTPPEARLDHGHWYFRKVMTQFIPTLSAWPSLPIPFQLPLSFGRTALLIQL